MNSNRLRTDSQECKWNYNWNWNCNCVFWSSNRICSMINLCIQMVFRFVFIIMWLKSDTKKMTIIYLVFYRLELTLCAQQFANWRWNLSSYIHKIAATKEWKWIRFITEIKLNSFCWVWQCKMLVINAISVHYYWKLNIMFFRKAQWKFNHKSA